MRCLKFVPCVVIAALLASCGDEPVAPDQAAAPSSRFAQAVASDAAFWTGVECRLESIDSKLERVVATLEDAQPRAATAQLNDIEHELVVVTQQVSTLPDPIPGPNSLPEPIPYPTAEQYAAMVAIATSIADRASYGDVQPPTYLVEPLNRVMAAAQNLISVLPEPIP